MYGILRTIEFLGGHLSKNEIVSMKLQLFYNKIAKKKMILAVGVTARKQSYSECFLQIWEIWLIMYDVLRRTIEFLGILV